MEARPQPSSSPISDYAEWIKKALGSRDSSDDFLGGIDFRPPANDETINYPVRQDEVRSAPEPVWPPRSWWDEKGIMPSYQDRIGASQAFLGKALDWWGMPSAVLNRASPEAATALNDITRAHDTASKGGLLAGVLLGMPALRKVGDALASRGHGTISQGAADATTAVGFGLASDAVAGNFPTGMNTHAAATHLAPVAMANRVFMPNLPDGIFKRGAIGAGAGLLTAFPDMSMTGDYGRGAVNASLGAVFGAAGRPNKNLPNYSTFRDDLKHTNMRDNYKNINLGIGSALATGSLIGIMASGQSPDIPLTTDEAKEFAMTRHLPPNPFPPPRPYIPEEYGYMQPNWPPQKPDKLMEMLREGGR